MELTGIREIAAHQNEVGKTQIEERIFNIRGRQVMIDRDLALLYGVETKRLNEQVKRNIERFPEDFMFQLTQEECFSLISEDLKSQFATSSWGGTRKKPYAFTENGIAMLSGVLKSETAIKVNIKIMRTFTRMRQSLIYNKDLLGRIEVIEHQQLKTQQHLHENMAKPWKTPSLKEGSSTVLRGKCGRYLQWLCDDAHNMVSKGRCLLRSRCQVRMPSCL